MTWTIVGLPLTAYCLRVGRGSGLKRICNETKALESYRDDRRPVFKSSPSQFMTTIYSMEYSQADDDAGNGELNGELNGQLSGTLNGTLSGTLSGTLNERQKSVLDFIAATPGVQAQVLIDKLLIPRDTLNKIIKTLTDRGLIERRGSKKTGGYYVKK